MKYLEQYKIDNYSREYWSRFADTISTEDRKRIELVLKCVPPDCTSALEIGCGHGEIINGIELENKMGLDIDAGVLNNVNCQTAVASAAEMTFPDKSWDVVIASEVLEHMRPEDYEAGLHEINRVAGRYILISVPNCEVLSSNYTRCVNCGAIYHRNFHFRTYSIRGLANLFKDFTLQYSMKAGNSIRSRTKTENFIRQRIFNSWAPSCNTICPECETNYFNEKAQASASNNRLRKKSGMHKFLANITGRERQRWIIALFERKESQ